MHGIEIKHKWYTLKECENLTTTNMKETKATTHFRQVPIPCCHGTSTQMSETKEFKADLYQ